MQCLTHHTPRYERVPGAGRTNRTRSMIVVIMIAGVGLNWICVVASPHQTGAHRPARPVCARVCVWVGTPHWVCRWLMAAGKRPVPFRTRKLSPPAPMVLPPGGGGRVGYRRPNNFTINKNREYCAPRPPHPHHRVTGDRGTHICAHGGGTTRQHSTRTGPTPGKWTQGIELMRSR